MDVRTKQRSHRFGVFRRDRGFVVRLAIYVVATALIAVGIAGLILPVLPGWPFIIAALVMLASVNRWIRHVLHRFLNRHPKIDHAYLTVRGAPRKNGAPPPATPTAHPT